MLENRRWQSRMETKNSENVRMVACVKTLRRDAPLLCLHVFCACMFLCMILQSYLMWVFTSRWNFKHPHGEIWPLQNRAEYKRSIRGTMCHQKIYKYDKNHLGEVWIQICDNEKDKCLCRSKNAVYSNWQEEIKNKNKKQIKNEKIRRSRSKNVHVSKLRGLILIVRQCDVWCIISCERSSQVEICYLQ